MNTKFSFALLIVVLVLTACAPAITGASAPITEPQIPAMAPVTGENLTGVRTVPEARLFSGEIFLSDNNNPDHEMNISTRQEQKPQSECMSEDSLPRPYGGCTE